MNKSYNGWSNWETWKVACYLNDDTYFTELCDDEYQELTTNHPKKMKDEDWFHDISMDFGSEKLRNYFQESYLDTFDGIMGKDRNGLISSLINNFECEVDWQELGITFLLNKH